MNYGNANFPETTEYIRNKNRLYFSTDFKDGEKIMFFSKCEKPSSNAAGYRLYQNEVVDIKLIHWNDIKHETSVSE